MRPTILVSLAALAVAPLPPAPAMAADDVAWSFQKLTRSSRWEPVIAVPWPSATHPPKGSAAVGYDMFLSSVETLEPAERFPENQGDYDRTPGNGKGHVFSMCHYGRIRGPVELGEG